MREMAVFYLILGVAAAVAWLSRFPERAPVALLVLPAWPLFAGLLLTPARPAAAAPPVQEPGQIGAEDDREIREVLRGLERALAPVAGDSLATQVPRLERVGRVLTTLAARCAEMDTLLSNAEFDPATVAQALAGAPSDPQDLRRRNLENRRRNLVQLRELRDRTRAELTSALDGLRGYTTELHLVRLSGAGKATRALVEQLFVSLDTLVAVVPLPGASDAETF